MGFMAVDTGYTGVMITNINSTYKLEIQNHGMIYRTINPFTISLNAWHNIRYKYRSTAQTMYIYNVLVDSATKTAIGTFYLYNNPKDNTGHSVVMEDLMQVKAYSI